MTLKGQSQSLLDDVLVGWTPCTLYIYLLAVLDRYSLLVGGFSAVPASCYIIHISSDFVVDTIYVSLSTQQSTESLARMKVSEAFGQFVSHSMGDFFSTHTYTEGLYPICMNDL